MGDGPDVNPKVLNPRSLCPRHTACPLQADMLGSMKAGSPEDSPELRGGMSRGASGALSERMVPRANSNGCAPAFSTTTADKCESWLVFRRGCCVTGSLGPRHVQVGPLARQY